VRGGLLRLLTRLLEISRYTHVTGGNTIGTMAVFPLFGALTLVALGYFFRKVPETKAGHFKSSNSSWPGRR